MLFSRVASFFAVSLTLGSLALAKPAPIEERSASIANVQQVVNSLQSTTNTVLPQLQNLASSNKVNEASVTPLMDQLITAFNNAHGSLTSLRKRELPDIEKRQANQLAQPVANIIKDTANTLQVVQAKGNFPSLNSKVSTLGVSMNNFVVIIGGLVPGLLGLVGGLVVTVAGLLNAVGLGLILGGLLGGIILI